MTAACQLCRDLIGGYVLDALEPDERDLVRNHLAVCERCAREHAELATIPALLDAADSAEPVPLRPPERLEEAVLDRFARERRGATPVDGDSWPWRRGRPRRRLDWRGRAIAAGGAAALAAVLVFAFAVPGSDRRTGDAPPAPRAQAYRVALAGDGPARDAAGEARLYPGETGTGVRLRVHGLKSRAYHYELWCIREDDGWKVSAGTFRVDAAGNADVRLTTAARPTEYDTLAIEAHRAGTGAERPGARVLVGRIGS